MADAPKKETAAPGAPELPKKATRGLDPEDTPDKPEKPAETDEAEKNTDEPLGDKQTDDAVEDIIRTESDELLEAKDKATEDTKPEPKPHFWRRKWFRWTLLTTAVALVVLFVVPTTRYWILNTLGVRASSSVTVVDDTTGQPLKNVKVTIGTSSATTGSDGKAVVKEIKLGPQTVELERIAFAGLKRHVTIGWGSNPLDTFRLKPVGAQYTLVARDYLSNKPIEGAEATNGDAAALADKDGKIVLTLDSDGSDVVATVSAKGYRSEEVILKAEVATPTDVVLVPATKAVFVTKETGKYDLYTMDIDGKNKKILLPGTGLENGNVGVAVSGDGERAVIVSTRDNVKASDGSLLNTITLVNTTDGEALVLDRGEQIKIIDWIGNRVVYQMTANVAADAADRQRIISYDYKAHTRAQLASANQIKSAASAHGAVYYAGPNSFLKVNPDGTNKQGVLEQEVSAAYRTTYNELSLQTAAGWYRLDLKTGQSSSIAEPTNYSNRLYVTNSSSQQSAWIDNTTLQLYTIATGKDAILHTQSGLTHPIRWLNDTTLIYRLVTSSDTADYAISSQGGAARKVGTVTGTTGINPSY